MRSFAISVLMALLALHAPMPDPPPGPFDVVVTDTPAPSSYAPASPAAPYGGYNQ